MLLGAVGLPVLVGLWVAGRGGAAAAATGAVMGLTVSVRAGWKVALASVPLLALALALGMLAAGTAAWPPLLAALALAALLAMTRGLLAPFAVAGMLAATAPRLVGVTEFGLRVTLATAGSVFAVVVMRWLGLPARLPSYQAPMRVAVPAAILGSCVAGVAAALALRSDNPFAPWIPTTVFLLLLPVPGVRVSAHARQRVVGTVLGVSVAVPIAIVAGVGIPRGLVVLPTLLMVFVFTEPLWLNAAITSVALVLVLDPVGDGIGVGLARIQATALGAALVLAGSAALTWWTRRRPAPTSQHDLVEDLVAAAGEPVAGPVAGPARPLT
jgi:hypothetical protein